MLFSFQQRKCHPLTRCIKRIADQPCYNVVFIVREHNTNIKNLYALYLPSIKQMNKETPIWLNQFSNSSSSNDENSSNNRFISIFANKIE